MVDFLVGPCYHESMKRGDHMKKKTADYTRKAIEKYQSGFERFTISLPIGSSEIIKAAGKSKNQLFNELFSEWKQKNNIE